MSEEKNKFIALYHFLDKPQDFNLEMNYYEFRDELKNLLDLYQKEKEKNKYIEVAIKTKLNFATSAYEHFEKEEMHNLALVEAGKIGILQELLEERN